jgi:hypothetical protein
MLIDRRVSRWLVVAFAFCLFSTVLLVSKPVSPATDTPHPTPVPANAQAVANPSEEPASNATASPVSNAISQQSDGDKIYAVTKTDKSIYVREIIPPKTGAK